MEMIQSLQAPRRPPKLQANKENLLQIAPYFESPAGLMCAMVPDHETKYRLLEPTKLCLPPPAPPTERLLEAVENFYLPSSHEHPRNIKSWEQVSLLDYYPHPGSSFPILPLHLLAPLPLPLPFLPTRSPYQPSSQRFRSRSRTPAMSRGFRWWEFH